MNKCLNILFFSKGRQRENVHFIADMRATAAGCNLWTRCLLHQQKAAVFLTRPVVQKYLQILLVWFVWFRLLAVCV